MQQPQPDSRAIRKSDPRDPSSRSSEAAQSPRAGWPESTEAFGELLDAYLDRLVRHAFARLGNIQDAEDVVQEVLVRVFRDRSKHAGISAVGPYLYRCVTNACSDLRRGRKRSTVSGEEVNIDSLFSAAKSPAEMALAAEALRRVQRLLGRLPKPQAEVVRLRALDGLRLAEIAEVVGCSVNTVCSRLRYGFRKLRDFVAEEGE